MSDIQVGKMIVSKADRDAIHVAILPCWSSLSMNAGDRIGLNNCRPNDKGWYEVYLTSEEESSIIGIVDPFLETSVPSGIGFWVFLKPGTATSLRHHYHFPAIDGETK